MNDSAQPRGGPATDPGARPTLPPLGPYTGRLDPPDSLRERVSPLVKGAIRTAAIGSARWRARPDFLIIGTKRGGTTSLYNYLLSHPDVAPTVPARQHIKGVYYFDVNAADRDSRWYRSHFPLDRPLRRRGAITGEATPYYLYHPHAAARAFTEAPRARIIALLRDPIDRAVSHHRERQGQGFEWLDFAAAVDAEPERLAGEHERLRRDPDHHSIGHQMWSYVDQGRYLAGIARWEERFGSDRMLVLSSEDFYADPAAVLDQTQRFLGLAPFALDDFPVWNRQQTDDLAPALRRRLVDELGDDVAALEAHLGRSFDWPSFR